MCDQQSAVCCATEWAWQNKQEHCDMIIWQHSTWQSPSKQVQCEVLHFFMLNVVECWKVWTSPLGPGSFTMWLVCVCSLKQNSRSHECVEAAVILSAFHRVLDKGDPLAGESVGSLIQSKWLLCVTFSMYLPVAVPEMATFQQAPYFYD
jgi:hypothetical protein